MTTFQLLSVCFTVLALACIAGTVLVHRVERLRDFDREHDREAREVNAPPTRVGHRVTVHTKLPDDQTIYGVVLAEYADRMILVDADYVTPTGPEPIPGRQHEIDTVDIAWVDVHALVALPGVAPVAATAETSA